MNITFFFIVCKRVFETFVFTINVLSDIVINFFNWKLLQMQLMVIGEVKLKVGDSGVPYFEIIIEVHKKFAYDIVCSLTIDAENINTTF